MKLFLVFNALTYIVVLATAYPTPWQGRSSGDSLNYGNLLPDVEKREDLNSDLFAYYYCNEKREELNSDLFDHTVDGYYQKKRSDLIAGVSKPESLEEGKREQLDSDLFTYTTYAGCMV
ncbi:hypothetical protein EDD22DRAFT_927819 [Suillus occidentalis]|nr:hypothetical protein EDD22DRAFT_927819 [Suillus occidentalis]